MKIRVMCAAALVAGSVFAQEERPSGWTSSYEIAAVSQYLWRGFVLNDSPSLQPGVTVGYKGLSVSSWNNFSRRGPNGQCWTEHDFGLDYSRAAGRFTISGGYLNYFLPDRKAEEGRVTHEFYAGVSHSSFLNPSFKVYRDVAEGDGNYFYGSVSHSWAIKYGVAITPLLGVGLNQHMYQSQTTISNVDGGFALDIPVGSVTVSPSFTRMVGHRSLFGSHNAFGLKMSYRRGGGE